jgi:hypothetical protein
MEPIVISAKPRVTPLGKNALTLPEKLRSILSGSANNYTKPFS